MSDPRFRPRDFTLEPDAFGVAVSLRWKTIPELLAEYPEFSAKSKVIEARLGAAKLQHAYAYRIRAQMKAAGMKPATYGRASTLTQLDKAHPADQINKVLRGAIIMRLEHIAMADLILGEISEFNRAAAARTRAPAGQAQPR